MKKRHHYRITIDHVMNSDGSVPDDKPIAFEYANHDDLMAIIEQLRQRADVGPGMAEPLGLGIKLFGGVMLENRSSAIFSGLWPHFQAFMQAFKAKSSNKDV